MWSTVCVLDYMAAFRSNCILEGTDTSMPKNVVECCDGLTMEFSVAAINVVKLCMTLIQNEHEEITIRDLE